MINKTNTFFTLTNAVIILMIAITVSGCGLRPHEQKLLNSRHDGGQMSVEQIITMSDMDAYNTPSCNPSIVDCNLITGTNYE